MAALTEDDCPLSDREPEGIPDRSLDQGDSHAPGTVRNYLSSAMAKLGVGSRHAAAHRAWEEGWI